MLENLIRCFKCFKYYILPRSYALDSRARKKIYFKKMQKEPRIGGFDPQHLSDSRGFDGKRVRKAIQRRTIDYNSVIIRYLEQRMVYQKRDYLAIQPESSFVINYLPPVAYQNNPMSSVTTKHIHTSTNKVRCPINCISWTPEGRRLITGASSGNEQ